MNNTQEKEFIVTFDEFLEKKYNSVNESEYYDSEELSINDFYDLCSDNDWLFENEGEVKKPNFLQRHKKKLIGAGIAAVGLGAGAYALGKKGGEANDTLNAQGNRDKISLSNIGKGAELTKKDVKSSIESGINKAKTNVTNFKNRIKSPKKL